MKILKRKIEVPKHIDLHSTVSLKSMGNIREIQISERCNLGATIKPISKEQYIVLSTGEVKQVEHHALNRTENLRNLEKSMHALSDLINANISSDNSHCCRFITFTYRENMQDVEQLYTDFRNFNKRYKRYMAKQGFHYEYIVTVEAQERGAFHLHGIFIFDTKAPYIDNATLAKIWKLGFVSIQAIDNSIDNIGKYLTAYLADLPIEDDTEVSSEIVGSNVKEVQVNGSSKRIIKSARLKMLPVGIRVFRYSRGIKKPQTKLLSYGEALEELSEDGYTKVNEYAVEIRDIERDFNSKYVKQTFKKYINNSICKDKGDKK